MIALFHPRRDARGFSLLEVLVSVGILAIGLTAMMPLVSYATQRQATARREATAAAIAVEYTEALRNEIRFDTQGATRLDLAGGANLSTYWRAEVLPHTIDYAEASAPLVVNGRPLPGCNDDQNGGPGEQMRVGPIPVVREGEHFSVCYDLTNANPANPCPGGNCLVQGVVKVLWRAPNGQTLARRNVAQFVGGE